MPPSPVIGISVDILAPASMRNYPELWTVLAPMSAVRRYFSARVAAPRLVDRRNPGSATRTREF